MNITVVIGANFGDEGKGLMADFFANQAKKGVVVRFNGGCQAGHTVVTPDGKRHVFGHVGSGAFVGWPTYLTKHFIVNPILFNREYEQLFHNQTDRMNLPWMHSVHVQPECMVTTVYDMLINQTVETFLKKNRHGSCGLGINETVERNLDPEYQILVSDSVEDMVKKLKKIQLEYVPERLNQLGIGDRVPANLKPHFSDNNIREAFVEDFKVLKAKIQVVDNQEAFLRDFENVIFEGAQGLLLDQRHPYFPHVTRSNTGIKNVVEILTDCKLQDQPVEIVYVTRCYMTRHGAGPFPTETKGMPYSKIKDLTNIPNEFQGDLRFGLLDINDLAQTIKNDLVLAEGLNYVQKLAVTCLDQMDEQAQFVHNGKELNGSKDTFLSILFQAAGIRHGYLSYGPNRNDIQIFNLKN